MKGNGRQELRVLWGIGSPYDQDALSIHMKLSKSVYVYLYF